MLKRRNASDEAQKWRVKVLFFFWGEKESQAGAHNQGDDYLFICMFVYLRVNNCE